MGDPVKRRATYEDLVAVPEHLVAEILDGHLVTSPRPAAPHALVATHLTTAIDGRFGGGGPGGTDGGPGGWVILHEPELHLHGNILVPDIAGWRRERMPEVPDAAAFELAPDWICEVLSSSTESHDRAFKMPIYAQERVGYAWLANPIAKLLEVYRLGPDGWILVGSWCDDARIRAAPFEAIELELARLWRR
jgi:Uma2 family endonuclease